MTKVNRSNRPEMAGYAMPHRKPDMLTLATVIHPEAEKAVSVRVQ